MLKQKKKTHLLKRCDPKLLFDYLTVHSVEPVNKLDYNRYDQLSGLPIAHQTAVPEVPGSISGSDKIFCVCLFVLYLRFAFGTQNTLFVMIFLPFLL